MNTVLKNRFVDIMLATIQNYYIQKMVIDSILINLNILSILYRLGIISFFIKFTHKAVRLVEYSSTVFSWEKNSFKYLLLEFIDLDQINKDN
jgi:hypothetical protein